MRGLAWSTLFGLVLALLVVVFAGALIFGTDPGMIAEHSICSNTGTALQMFSYFDGVTVASPDDPSGILGLCKPRIVSVRERATDEVITRRIGDELVICQNSFGGGQVNLFRDESRGSLTRYCGLCAKVDFEEDASEERYVEGFEEHLATYVVPGTEQTIGQILNQDLAQTEARSTFESEDLADDQVFDSGTVMRGVDLAVLYVYDKRASRARNVFEAAGVGALGGFGVGSAPAVRGTGAAVGRAIGARVVWPAVLGRAVGSFFGGSAAIVLTGTAGAVTGILNDDLYTDEWRGGVVMIPWESLLAEIEILDESGGSDQQTLSSVLGCQQYINFIQDNT